MMSPDQVTVECPECGTRITTHDVGDVVGCSSCGERYNRFTNIVEES